MKALMKSPLAFIPPHYAWSPPPPSPSSNHPLLFIYSPARQQMVSCCPTSWSLLPLLSLSQILKTSYVGLRYPDP